MAKRKSLNKRLSRYSKHSIGSAILDPDTETLSGEYPYWWKNVENNTIMRPSIDSNVLNQTSRHLDSDSHIETSETEDEWWKVLEDSNTSKTLKMKMNIAKNAEKVASNNNTSTSESLGEVKIARKKFRMRSKPKRSRDNAFLNALDASTATSTVELGQVDGRKGSTGNSATVGAMVTNLKNINETEENSFNQSQKSTAVLKLKPKIFNKNYKNNDKNLFYDVLKESKLQISSREGSNVKLQTATNSPVANSARSDNSALSLEDANDIPHVFVPEAQSTILEGSTSSTHDSNSDIIRKVFEKKSKLLTRYKANMKRDLFEDTLEGRESTDQVRKSDLIRRNVATGGEAVEQSARSSRISEASEKDVRKKGEHAGLPMKNTNEFPESNVLAKTCVTSSDTLVLSEDFTRSPKTRMKVVTRLGKHSGQVQFKNLLDESDSIDKDVTARSKDLLHLSREENLAFDNVEPVGNKNNEVGESDSKNSAESRNFYLNLSYTSSDSKLSNLQKQVFQRDASKIFQSNDLEISGKRKSGNRKRSELVSPIAEKDKSAETPDVSPTRITESVSEEAKSDPRRNSEKKSRAEEKLVSPVEKEKDILVESENIAKRQSDRVSRSYRLSAAVFEGKESEGGSPTQSNRRQSSTRELVSPVGVEDDLEEREEDISKKQTDRWSKSIKQYSLRLVSSDSEPDEDKVDSPKRSSRKQRRTREELVAPVGAGDHLEKSGEDDISKEQSDRLTKSKIYSLGNATRVSEVKDVENTPQRSTRSRSKVSLESVSSVTEQNRTMEAPDISTRQSDRPSKPMKHSFGLTSSDSEGDEDKADSIKQNSTGELVASVGVEDELDEREEDISKQQSDRLSKSKIYSLRNSVRVSEVKDVESSSQRSLRSRSKVSLGSVSSVTEQNRTTEAHDISIRQSDRSSKSIKQYSLRLVSSDSEADENKAGRPKRSSRKQRRTREDLVAPVGTGDDLEESEEDDISKQQSDRLSKSKIYSLRNSVRVSKVKDVESSSQRSLRSRSKVSLGSVSSVTEQNRTTETRDIFKKRSDSTIQSGLFESVERREEKENDEVNGTQRSSILSAVEDVEEMTSSNARKRLTLTSRDEMEPEEAENTMKRQKRNSNRIEARQSFSNVVSEIDEGDATRKSSTANLSEKRVVLSGREKAAAESQDENSFVQQKVSKVSDKISVLGDSSVEKVREGVNRKNQSLSGRIKEISTTEMSKSHFTNSNDRRDGSSNRWKFDDGSSVNEREENARNVSRDKGVESKLQRDTNEGTNRLTRSVADKEQHFRESGGKVSGSKATNLTASTRTRKLLSSNVSKGQQSIESFFDSVRRLPESGEIGKKVSLEDVNKKLEKVKEWAMSRVNIRRNNKGEARAVSKQKRVKEGGGKKANPNPIAQRRPVAKQIHKAFLVNGQVYKVPRLPRPKTWITDRLYNHLWKRLEPKYKLQTRVISEKFIIQLSNVATLILKRKLYDNYKAELHALMKEMARLGLISTRKHFYDFCHEFFPYELRVKIVPMLLPGNKRNIPYNANNLHTPLLADK
ncbi:hypothetical protein ANTRET_LOCUS8993 [Anthophora retusa]